MTRTGRATSSGPATGSGQRADGRQHSGTGRGRDGSAAVTVAGSSQVQASGREQSR
ncbi:hypothetical protein ABK046_09825 [Streptomyces caeruleatus]